MKHRDCDPLMFQQQNNLNWPFVLFQMPVWPTPVSMEAPARTETGRFIVSVCQHTEETSVRLVSSHVHQTSGEAGSCFIEFPVNKEN